MENFKINFEKLFANELPLEQAREFLGNLHKKGETKEEIVEAAKIMKKYATSLHVKDELKDKIIDVVGTGGDKKGSFNISSTVALILASMDVPVAKHGNKAATSKSGSADMLEALGIELNLSPMQQEVMLNEVNFIFMFAKNYHPGMKYIMPVRKSLDHPTIFNYLGPLTNPANARRNLFGVFPKDIQQVYAEVLLELDTINTFVVNSRDGLDEVSISDITDVLHVKDGEIKGFELNPEEYGFKLQPFKSVLGGTAQFNASITKDILNNKANDGQMGIVLLNSALAFVASGKARDVKDGIDMAKEAIESKKALTHLTKIVELSQKL